MVEGCRLQVAGCRFQAEIEDDMLIVEGCRLKDKV